MADSFCQECKQAFTIDQSIEGFVKESYELLEEQVKKEKVPLLTDQQLYFFDFYGDTTDNSHQVEKDLLVKDMAIGKNLKLIYPVCYDCFRAIIEKMDNKI